jgi:hypothetical protein
MTTAYVDPQSIHNPATGTSPPATWGDTVRDDLETTAKPARCRAVRATSGLNVTDATWTAVNFNDESWDTDTMHNTVTNNTRITIPTGFGGYWLVTGLVLMSAEATIVTTSARGARITTNGGSARNQFLLLNANNQQFRSTFSDIMSLSAGDYIELEVWHNSGETLTADVGTALSVIQISW